MPWRTSIRGSWPSRPSARAPSAADASRPTAMSKAPSTSAVGPRRPHRLRVQRACGHGLQRRQGLGRVVDRVGTGVGGEHARIRVAGAAEPSGGVDENASGGRSGILHQAREAGQAIATCTSGSSGWPRGGGLAAPPPPAPGDLFVRAADQCRACQTGAPARPPAPRRAPRAPAGARHARALPHRRADQRMAEAHALQIEIDDRGLGRRYEQIEPQRRPGADAAPRRRISSSALVPVAERRDQQEQPSLPPAARTLGQRRRCSSRSRERHHAGRAWSGSGGAAAIGSSISASGLPAASLRIRLTHHRGELLRCRVQQRPRRRRARGRRGLSSR